jgi:hypothetical protein
MLHERPLRRATSDSMDFETGPSRSMQQSASSLGEKDDGERLIDNSTLVDVKSFKNAFLNMNVFIRKFA